MKNAIITWFHYENYGTALQAFALQEFLSKKEKDVEVINYIPQYNIENVRKKVNIKNICIFLLNKKKKLYNLIINSKYANKKNKRTERFIKFTNQKIRLTKTKYTRNNINELNEKYENFIVGSDQIWNPNNIDYTYYLDFTEKNKIAYAPSFGVNKLNDYQKKLIKSKIEKFNYISVRENAGKYIIKDLIDVDVPVLLDPTMLLSKEEWEDIVTYKKDEKYILCYFLGNNNFYWKYVKKLQKNTGLKIRIIPIQAESYLKKGEILPDAGPIEFVNLIANAEIICTDSFHGTVFSIIFEKNFSVLKRFNDNDERSQNSRIYNLLKLLKKEKNIVETNNKEFNYKVHNYKVIKNILNKKRTESIEFLDKSINRR